MPDNTSTANTAGFSRNVRWLLILLIFLTVYLGFTPVSRFRDPFSTVITDRYGALLGARVADDGQWRFPPADTIPVKIEQATLVFEDRFFRYHPGINPAAIFRALKTNIREGRIVSGASTITMQTVRLCRKGRPRTFTEKLIEMFMSYRLELEYSKSDILAMYLSHAPYGGNVVGITAASWRYFGTSPRHLSWAEAATLAILPNSPSLVHPGKNRYILVQKRNRLLRKLHALKKIDDVTLETSLAEEIPPEPFPMPMFAAHLLNRVDQAGRGNIYLTTIDAAVQQEVLRVVENHHRALQGNEIHNAAALIMETETGNVLAYVGNCGYPLEKNHGNDVDIIRSPRSTGSLLKPLLFAAMIDDGRLLPGSLVPDIPVNLGGFSPENFNGLFEGAVPAKKALSRSLNVPAVEMLRSYGIERFHNLLRSLGIKTLDMPAAHYGLSLILGGGEGTLEELTNIYASLARVLNHYGETGSYYSTDYRPASILSATSTVQAKPSLQAGIFNASSVWSTFEAMLEVNRPEEEAGWQYFRSSAKIAWKTGTSFGYRDAWAIGVSSKYVVGVWVGNADGEGRPGLTGIAAAAPVMFDIFGLLPKSAWFRKPADELIPATVCRVSGFLAGPECPERDSVFIPMAGTKSPACPYHRLVHLSFDGRYRVTGDCYPVDSMKHVSWFILPPVQEWYYRKRHSDYRLLPEFLDNCQPSGTRSMGLIYPSENVRVFIPKELQGEKGRVVFEAVHRNPGATIYWHLDNQFIAQTKYIHQVELLPESGFHRVTLVDDTGEELVRNFEVVEP